MNVGGQQGTAAGGSHGTLTTAGMLDGLEAGVGVLVVDPVVAMAALGLTALSPTAVGAR